jgi:hypothetical protein
MKKSVISLTGTLLLVLLAATSAQAESCDAIEQYIEWRGGENFQKLESFEIVGTLETSGLAGTARQALRRDGYSYFEFNIQSYSGIEALTPEGGWEKSLSGQIDAMGEGQAAGNRRTIDEAFALSLQGEGKGKVSCPGPEQREGKTYNVIRVAFEDGSWFDYFLTPDEGALDWTRSQRDNKITWTGQLEWKFVDGVRFAHGLNTIEENPDQNAVFKWTEATPNKNLPNELFARPVAGTSLLQFVDGATSSGWIDFNFFKKRRLIMDALVNGHETTMILDSGAEATVIDKSFADSIGLEGEGELSAQGVAGSTKVSIAQGVTIEVGNLKATNLTVIIIDLSHIGKSIGHPLNVVFGEEVFNELIVDIDYPGERIAFHRPESFSTKDLGPTLEITSAQGGQKEIAVSVNGLAPALVGLDTGSGDTITFFKPWTDTNNVLDDLNTSTRLSGGVGGESVSLIGTVQSIEIGSFVLEDVPVSFFRSAEGAFATSEIAWNMGVQIFRQFRTTFDFGKNRLYLTPPQGGLNPTFSRDRTGLQTIKKESGLEVSHVAKNSPAEAAGWKVGDTIIAIDGKSIGSDYWEELYRWNMSPEGTVLTLRTDDELRRLTCRNYY